MPRSFAFGVYPGCVLNPAKLYPSVSRSTEATMEHRILRFGFASGKMHPKNMELGRVASEEEFLERLGVGDEAMRAAKPCGDPIEMARACEVPRLDGYLLEAALAYG